MKYLLLAALPFLLFTCGSDSAESVAPGSPSGSPDHPTETPTSTPAEKLLSETLAAHGGDRYDTAAYSFTFRTRRYTFKNDGTNYRYTSDGEKDGVQVFDVLDSGDFLRRLDGTTAELTEKEVQIGSDALNSVIYFATLPHKLQDPAVNLEIAGVTSIKGNDYDVLAVNFNEENGGTDHDDNFRYWINKATKRIDYLAYDYRVEGGGVRFRSAYNPRVVEGILFQDYVNYKAEVGTDLDELPALYEAGELQELSRIETEDVTILPQPAG